MTELFLKLVNLSILAGWLILAVIAVRLIFKKAPKWLLCALWALVAIRLICPFTLESTFSLQPSASPIQSDIITSPAPEINTGVPILNDVINPILSDSLTPAVGDSANPLQIWLPIFTAVWLSGIAVLLLYAVVSTLRLRKKLRTAILLRENIWQSDAVDSPFVLGILKPRMYLPFSLSEAQMPYIIAHEQAHLRRHDHWIKPFGFLLLCLYWFHPLVWVAYLLLCRDIELACDEKVVKDYSVVERADYSEALLSCSIRRKMITACPVAFGEVAVKDRVKNVLHFKKPAFWILLCALLAATLLAVGFLTGPISKNYEESAKDFADACIYDHHKNQLECFPSGFAAMDFEIYGAENKQNTVTLYGWVDYRVFLSEQNRVNTVAGCSLPTVITLRKLQEGKDGTPQYELAEYWEPRDGRYYVKDLKQKLPLSLRNRFLHGDRSEQKDRLLAVANAHFSGYSTSITGEPGPNSINAGSDCDKVEVRGVHFFLQEKTGHLMLELQLKAPSDYLFGRSFRLLEKKQTEWVEMPAENSFFTSEGLFSTEEQLTITYDLSAYYCLNGSGEYRFETRFHRKNGDPNQTFTAWVEFAYAVGTPVVTDINTGSTNASIGVTRAVFSQTPGVRDIILYAQFDAPGCKFHLTRDFALYREEGGKWVELPRKEDAPDRSEIYNVSDGTHMVYNLSQFYLLDTPGNYQVEIKVGMGSGNTLSDTLWVNFQYRGQLSSEGLSPVEELRIKYPECFDLDDTKGLEVYVWQMAAGSYRCAIRSGTNRDMNTSELLALPSTTIAEMKVILSDYQTPAADIFVIPIQHPLSSYLDPLLNDETYLSSLKTMLGLDAKKRFGIRTAENQ